MSSYYVADTRMEITHLNSWFISGNFLMTAKESNNAPFNLKVCKLQTIKRKYLSSSVVSLVCLALTFLFSICNFFRACGYWLFWNCQGYLAGNPITNTSADFASRVPFAHGTGLISDELYEVEKEKRN